MKQVIKKLTQIEFVRNVMTLMTGTVLAQAIPLAISPKLTRLYTPADFGVYALFLSLTGILSIASAGRYELAIMLPKNDKHARYLLSSSIMIVTGFSAFVALLLHFFSPHLLNLLNHDGPSRGLIFIPLGVFLTGINQVLFYWLNRKKSYPGMRNARVIQTSTTAAIMLATGFMGWDSLGLVLGYVLGQFAGIVELSRHILKGPSPWEKHRKKQWALVKKYKKFPLYSGPTKILYTISTNLLIFVLTTLFGPVIVGFYSLANKVTDLPLNLISSSFSSVFFEKFVNTDKKMRLYVQSFFINLFLGLVTLLPLFFFGEELFGFVFGDAWREAGKIASILSPFLLLSYSVGSVSTTFSALHRNELSLLWQIAQVAVIAGVIWLYKDGFYPMLKAYAAAGGLTFLALLFLGVWAILKAEKKNASLSNSNPETV